MRSQFFTSGLTHQSGETTNAVPTAPFFGGMVTALYAIAPNPLKNSLFSAPCGHNVNTASSVNIGIKMSPLTQFHCHIFQYSDYGWLSYAMLDRRAAQLI